MAAMAISPSALTTKGRAPCLPRSLKLVRRPTPAKVSRKAQRLRLPRASELRPGEAEGGDGGGVLSGAEGGEKRDEQEAEDELGELGPEKGGLVAAAARWRRAARPLRAHCTA